MPKTDDTPRWLSDLLAKYGNQPEPPPEIVWRADARRGVSRLPAAERAIIEQAIERLRRDISAGKNALDYCDTFAEISAGRYTVFYRRFGDRIEITGLKRIR